MYHIAQVESLEDPRVLEAETLHFNAFANDRVTNAMVGGRPELRRLVSRTCIRAGVVGGKLYVALNESEEVVGTGIWYPSGKEFLADEEQQKEGALELLATIEKVDPGLHEWWMTTLLPSNAETTDKFLGKDFKINNWNLYSLAVAEEHRRKGVARMLVKAGEDQAILQSLSTSFEAENEQNIEIYQRLGYEVVGHTFVPGPPNAEGYKCYSLAKYLKGEVKKSMA